MLLPLDLLYPKMVFVHGDTQDYLSAVLFDDELVQLLSQRLGRDVTGSYIAGVAQRASEGLIGLIEGGEALPAEVGSIVRGRFATGWQGSTARDGVECQVGCAGLWRDRGTEGPLEYHSEETAMHSCSHHGLRHEKHARS
jgi:hypothetical protein